MADRILICGDRNWTDWEAIYRVVATFDPETVVIEGEARGADRIARHCAQACGLAVLPFPAEWDRYGRAAGPVRNQRMLHEGRPTRAYAFHDAIETSRGTADMVRRLRRASVPVVICRHEESL